jgi:hypothetical protein
MLTILAQAKPSVFDSVNSIFSRLDTLAHPEKLMETLRAMSAVWAVIFLAAGLICLFQGYKIYKTVTVILALAIGAFAGYSLGKRIDAEYVVAGCMAILLAVTCFPLMKYAVAALGGLVGAFLGANSWSAMSRLINEGDHTTAGHYWVGALVGLLICGMLAFILFKITVVMFTSISGSTIAVLGGVALLLQIDLFADSVSHGISAHSAILPLLVLVPALIGFILQELETSAVGGSGDGGKPAAKGAAAS